MYLSCKYLLTIFQPKLRPIYEENTIIRVLLMLFGTPALCMRRCIGHELIVDYLFIGFTGDVVASMRNSCASKLNRTGVVVVVRISLPNNPLVTYSGPSSDGLISDSRRKKHLRST